ncbi:MAG: pyrimidine reductase family protein [Actinobacteria bacterium]|nr:pyrimidine reductase family protein [Actinomycetota bacterium]
MLMLHGPQPGPVDDDALSAVYPWPDTTGKPYVRAMMVCTLDGAAAGDDGLSGSVSGGADRSVLRAVRRFADVVLVGGGTMKAEGYGPLKARPEDADVRRDAGQAPAPVLAVVSGSLDLPLDPGGFTDSDVTPIVFTTSSADPARVEDVRKRCEVVQLPGEKVDAEQVVQQLHRRGLGRIVCEGGPGLLHQVTESGLLDEADITIAPMLVGTDKTPSTPMVSDPSTMTLQHVLTAEEFLMLRYTRGTGTGTAEPSAPNPRDVTSAPGSDGDDQGAES